MNHPHPRSVELIAMFSNWRHSGFQVFCGQRIFPRDETAMENLARYIIQASFSQERMIYMPQMSQVIYASKYGKAKKGSVPYYSLDFNYFP